MTERQAIGLTEIARRVGVTRAAVHNAIRQSELPGTRVDGVHAVRDVSISDYRRELGAIPAWENEGGACWPGRKDHTHDHA